MITLPETLPIFPLTGVILLPKQVLPLQLFEPRYVAMAKEAMKGDQAIGMIQPRFSISQLFKEQAELEQVGGMGKIICYKETKDGRVHLILEGVSRFQALEELAPLHGYRRVKPDYDPFIQDVAEEREPLASTQVAFALRRLLEPIGLSFNWKEIDNIGGEAFLNFLCFRLPLLPQMKQELLESMSLQHRLELLQGYLGDLLEALQKQMASEI